MIVLIMGVFSIICGCDANCAQLAGLRGFATYNAYVQSRSGRTNAHPARNIYYSGSNRTAHVFEINRFQISVLQFASGEFPHNPAVAHDSNA